MAAQRMLLTGGTGLIGGAVVALARERGWEPVVLTRDAARARRTLGGDVRCVEQLADAGPPRDFAAVVNLAGASVFAPWSDARRRAIRESRVGITRAVVNWMRGGSGDGLPALISGSGIGAYGPCGDEPVDETHARGDDFLASVCREWEGAACEAEAFGARVCLVRTGLVLAREGGALATMLPAFKLGLGAVLGTGRQYMPWIHGRDEAGLIVWLAENEAAKGPFNACAPEPVTNREFTRMLSGHLRRPALFRAPSFVLSTAMGDMAELLTTGQRGVPRAALDGGYAFQFPTLEGAFADLL